MLDVIIFYMQHREILITALCLESVLMLNLICW